MMAMGRCSAKRLAKSSRSRNWATVNRPGQADDVGQGEFAEPLALVNDLGPVSVNDLEELAKVGLGVFHHLFVGEHGPGSGAATGVANLGGPVSDNEDEPVTQVLQLAELAKAYHVAEVNIGTAGVEAHFESQRLAFLKQLDELFADDDVVDAALGNAPEFLGAKGHWYLRRRPARGGYRPHPD